MEYWAETGHVLLDDIEFVIMSEDVPYNRLKDKIFEKMYSNKLSVIGVMTCMPDFLIEMRDTIIEIKEHKW